MESVDRWFYAVMGIIIVLCSIIIYLIEVIQHNV